MVREEGEKEREGEREMKRWGEKVRDEQVASPGVLQGFSGFKSTAGRDSVNPVNLARGNEVEAPDSLSFVESSMGL